MAKWLDDFLKGVKFIIFFAAVLALLLLIDQAGGFKLVAYCLIAYSIAMWLQNQETIKDMFTEIMYKLFG